MKYLLLDQQIAFNKLIFGGKVEFREALEGEEVFAEIEKKMRSYCESNIEVWKLMNQREVNFEEIKEKI